MNPKKPMFEVFVDFLGRIKNRFTRSKSKTLKASYYQNELHDEVTMKIRDFVNKMPEFETSPLIVCQKENEKGFGVFSENGNGDWMKRFTITIEDHKKFLKAPQQADGKAVYEKK